MWTNQPPQPLRVQERLQLTPDEVRQEVARQMSITTGRPARVRNSKVEVLYGDVWVEHLERTI